MKRKLHFRSQARRKQPARTSPIVISPLSPSSPSSTSSSSSPRSPPARVHSKVHFHVERSESTPLWSWIATNQIVTCLIANRDTILERWKQIRGLTLQKYKLESGFHFSILLVEDYVHLFLQWKIIDRYLFSMLSTHPEPHIPLHPLLCNFMSSLRKKEPKAFWELSQCAQLIHEVMQVPSFSMEDRDLMSLVQLMLVAIGSALCEKIPHEKPVELVQKYVWEVFIYWVMRHSSVVESD